MNVLKVNLPRTGRWHILAIRCGSTLSGGEIGSGTGIGQITGRLLNKTGESFVNVPSTKIVTSLPPLTEAVPGLPEVEYARQLAECSTTHITTLSNGLRVASEPRFGQFCTVGVIVDSSPRYEVQYPSGISHFIEKLAYNSTINFPGTDVILMELEKYGGICDCQTSREAVIYAASIDTNNVEPVIRLLADVALRPILRDEEVTAARRAVQFELEALVMSPEQRIKMMDMIHEAAYNGKTVGLPKLCPPKNLHAINRDVLMTYLKHHHTPERMVVAGVGIDHDILVHCCEKYFVKEPAIWECEGIRDIGISGVDDSAAKYTGGLRKEACEMPSFIAAGLPELAHVVIGLEGCSLHDRDLMAICVLNIMVGGGGSFSVGGPGKGMYSRLYTNVLNRHPWLDSATAINFVYKDTGLFVIHATSPPNFLLSMVKVIVREMVNMASGPEREELMRAKVQLQSTLLMNLEPRPTVFEDIGRQVMTSGKRKQPMEYIHDIESITAADVRRVAQRILASPPSIAARGNIHQLPEKKYIEKALGHSRKSIMRRL